MRSLLEKDFLLIICRERGVAWVKRCFQCKVEEQLVDHILLHSSNAKVLWGLLFPLFCVPWVLLTTIKDTFREWYGSFVDQDVNRSRELLLYKSFWRKEIVSHSENDEQPSLVLKGLYL